MATMNVKDAAGSTVAVEKPNANGRAAAAASRPVALSTEDKAALDAVASQTTLAAILAKIIAAPATAANQETALTALGDLVGHVDGIETLLGTLGTQTTLAAVLAAVQGLVGNEYEAVAASQTDQVLGATGAVGDLLVELLIVPATTSPGAVLVQDGSGGSEMTVFAGGASSVSTLHPFVVPLNIKAGSAGWRVTTGADVSVIATGNFT